jgi:hypothetical protein
VATATDRILIRTFKKEFLAAFEDVLTNGVILPTAKSAKKVAFEYMHFNYESRSVGSETEINETQALEVR